ncbi:hypothetical protein IG631_10333 [Alternaria alternata]|nr:hypothetical protein IG631_10333 [Alternaria alternata]
MNTAMLISEVSEESIGRHGGDSIKEPCKDDIQVPHCTEQCRLYRFVPFGQDAP